LPLLLLMYIATCQRFPDMTRNARFCSSAIGTVAPAVIGTEPTGLATDFWSTAWRGAPLLPATMAGVSLLYAGAA
jgi:hypothetical protein